MAGFDYNDPTTCDEHWRLEGTHIVVARKGRATVYAGDEIILSTFLTEEEARKDFAWIVDSYVNNSWKVNNGD